MKPVEVSRQVIKYANGIASKIEDTIVSEYTVTVKVNGQELVTMVCTPEYIEDMVIGYLTSEGLIKGFKDVEDIWVQEKEGYVHIKVSKLNPFYNDLSGKRYITSCCGMSRQGFVFANDALTSKRMQNSQVTLSPDDCFRLMKEMQEEAFLFQNTGGVHNAALGTIDGLLLNRKDIGRHNALDKIYGHCLRNEISMQDKIIIFSGRISSEILLKVAKIGCAVVLSKSAPTELALDLADELGITAVGFIRNSSMNVYTHSHRITSD
ncbi:formate dehydrogenase accessory sulfurtransferase FdhD [Peribacillus sp. SCS-37]|uniref:formate dehydrogenase accessory sulfurtransferase FdhD n=1 Tax=Paraperibacillus esterisolvens TaxID=3115296 RepID=UPI00390666C1